MTFDFKQNTIRILQNNTFSGFFVGQNIVRLTTVDSTNTWLRNSISNSAPFPEGTVILADNQTMGRGQVNAGWVSERGKNLTLSILLQPHFLSIQNQFDLNKSVCLAMVDTLEPILKQEVLIKWPNDIYVNQKKIAGILIENIISGNVIKYAIIGIGLNVNQEIFPDDLNGKATSVRQILHHDYDLNILLNDLCRFIEARYLQLKNKSDLGKSYTKKLYRLNQPTKFKTPDLVFEGQIEGVSTSGLIQIRVGNEIKEFDLKQIALV